MGPRLHSLFICLILVVSGSLICNNGSCDKEIVPRIQMAKAAMSKLEKCRSTAEDLGVLDPEYSREDRWLFRGKPHDDSGRACASIRPNARDIVKRFYAILPYFDREHSNVEFLHKFRATVNSMSQGDDLLDREAAFYATVVTPLVFMQNYRDTWCLLQRFHRALRLYQISHPTEKRAALKLLQNMRAINHKMRSFVGALPGPSSVTRTTPFPEPDDDDQIADKKDIRYLKELIKNLG